MYTLYARREPTTDLITLKYDLKSKRTDVVIYTDNECKEFKVRIPYYYTPKLTRNKKTIILNCNKYKLEWK